MSESPVKRNGIAKPRRRRTTKRVASSTTDHILQAARNVLVRYGYAGFTTRRVAEAAAISPGNLSYHFPSKRELLQALIAWLVADYSGQFQTFLSNAEIPAGQELQHLVRWLLADAVTEVGVRTFRELWAMSLHDPVIRRATDNLYDELMAHVAALLQRSHPNVDAKAIREVVQFLALMSEGSIVLYGTRYRRAVPFDRIIELTIQLLERIAPGLQPTAAARRRRPK
ncbi:MAG TPA: hypothetical protein DIC36_00255 [Gammaproteobacteria bacterium]|nr:hypothetical protein [Gammaproteobacteria bacterium]